MSEGGGTVQEFEFRALDYDETDTFLGHYFRNKYDTARKLSLHKFNVQITRVEVWVPQK